MCTGIMLRTTDGSVVSGRTVEFGVLVDTTAVVVPRGYRFVGHTPDGDGLSYTARFGVAGLIAYDDLSIMDGINEAGLAAGAFYFPTFAEYPAGMDAARTGLSPSEFTNWVLTQFSTVAEVRDALVADAVTVTPTVVPGWGPEAPPFHYAVYDRSGDCVVVEPVGGRLVVHDDPLGVVTNSPPFDWHMTNLRNFIALDPRNVPPAEVAGMTFQQLGQGSGMLGLPGDFTPPSRLVRAAVFSATAEPSTSPEDAVHQLFHILNTFDIPVGVARAEGDDGVVRSDYTQVTTARDARRNRYYFRTYEDQTIRMVDLGRFDLTATDVVRLPTAGSGQRVVDISAHLS